jgi:hypothetical protein
MSRLMALQVNDEAELNADGVSESIIASCFRSVLLARFRDQFRSVVIIPVIAGWFDTGHLQIKLTGAIQQPADETKQIMSNRGFGNVQMSNSGWPF